MVGRSPQFRRRKEHKRQAEESVGFLQEQRNAAHKRHLWSKQRRTLFFSKEIETFLLEEVGLNVFEGEQCGVGVCSLLV